MNLPAHVREATGDDLDAVLEVQRACHEAPQWSAAHYEEMLRGSPATGRRRAVFVAEADERFLGYIVVAVTADEAELESVAVLPEARRQGLARALCGAALVWTASAGINEMWLEVRSANGGARALYRQLGFVPVGVRPRYYADPEDDAILMRANLRQAGHL